MFQISESTNFEDPWFCGRDVCEILEYKDIHQALQKHVQQKSKKTLKELSEELCVETTHNSVLGLHNLSTKYHDGKTVYINEPGLYALILKSKAPLANQFQDFICGIVLP
jgi:prophage antirepressor-like protein